MQYRLMKTTLTREGKTLHCKVTSLNTFDITVAAEGRLGRRAVYGIVQARGPGNRLAQRGHRGVRATGAPRPAWTPWGPVPGGVV